MCRHIWSRKFIYNHPSENEPNADSCTSLVTTDSAVLGALAVQCFVMAFVYDSIDSDVGKKLREINPDPHHGKNHHQWLKEFGREQVHDQITKVVTINLASRIRPKGDRLSCCTELHRLVQNALRESIVVFGAEN
jgi:hypothetical protein